MMRRRRPSPIAAQVVGDPARAAGWKSATLRSVAHDRAAAQAYDKAKREKLALEKAWAAEANAGRSAGPYAKKLEAQASAQAQLLAQCQAYARLPQSDPAPRRGQKPTDLERARVVATSLQASLEHARREVPRALAQLEAKPSWPRPAKDIVIAALQKLLSALESARLTAATTHLRRMPAHFTEEHRALAALDAAVLEGAAMKSALSRASVGDAAQVRAALATVRGDPARARGGRRPHTPARKQGRAWRPDETYRKMHVRPARTRRE